MALWLYDKCSLSDGHFHTYKHGLLLAADVVRASWKSERVYKELSRFDSGGLALSEFFEERRLMYQKGELCQSWSIARRSAFSDSPGSSRSACETRLAEKGSAAKETAKATAVLGIRLVFFRLGQQRTGGKRLPRRRFGGGGRVGRPEHRAHLKPRRGELPAFKSF